MSMTYEELLNKLKEMKLEDIANLVGNAAVFHSKNEELLEKAKRENNTKEITYHQGVIDGLNILLQPLK